MSTWLLANISKIKQSGSASREVVNDGIGIKQYWERAAQVIVVVIRALTASGDVFGDGIPVQGQVQSLHKHLLTGKSTIM